MKSKTLGHDELNRLLTLKSTKLRIQSACEGNRVDIFKTRSGIVIGKVKMGNSPAVHLVQIDNPIDFEISRDLEGYCVRAVTIR